MSLVFATLMAAVPTDAQAGPLLDWLRGRCRRPLHNRCCNTGCNTCATPSYAAVPTATSVARNAYNLQPGQCARTCNQTCSRTVVNYVPYTAYRSSWCRVPVTQYKPVTHSDPCTGCTVTCMKPCTSYSWQMKQEPYTTYRPVYRQENYSVPVTTITNDCATGNCGTCATGTCNSCPTGNCGTGFVNPGRANQGFAQTPNYAGQPAVGQPVVTQGATNPPGTYYTAPNSTLSTGQTFAPAAESVPTLPAQQQNFQRPVIDQFPAPRNSAAVTNTAWPQTADNSQRTNSNINPVADEQYKTPACISFETRTAQSPALKRWSYSPVRQASYTTPVESNGPVEIRGRVERVEASPAITASQTRRQKNAGWETVEK